MFTLLNKSFEINEVGNLTFILKNRENYGELKKFIKKIIKNLCLKERIQHLDNFKLKIFNNIYSSINSNSVSTILWRENYCD